MSGSIHRLPFNYNDNFIVRHDGIGVPHKKLVKGEKKKRSAQNRQEKLLRRRNRKLNTSLQNAPDSSAVGQKREKRLDGNRAKGRESIGPGFHEQIRRMRKQAVTRPGHVPFRSLSAKKTGNPAEMIFRMADSTS